MTTQPDNARTITRNSFWYAFDSSGATIVMLIASVPVARVLGPEVLGHYIFLVFVTSVAQRLANVGIPATACKYMAEYLGRGDRPTAHEIYRVTLRHQARVATLVTAAGCLLVPLFAEPGYRGVALWMVLSMWPGMVNNIPAQANVACENLRGNAPANWVNFGVYLVGVFLTLHFGWGLTGLAISTFISRAVEALVRYQGVAWWLHDVPRTPLDADLSRRMMTFSMQNVVFLALGLVVWDRSELLFLKGYSDVQQIAFYSLAFSITNQLLMVPRAFSSAIGVSIFAQYGRDRTLLGGLMRNATRYVSLIAVPMFLGLAAIADPLIRGAYGARYLPVIPVLWILSVFSIPRAFQSHIETLLQATENQAFMVRWLLLAAAMNVSLDWLLIPAYGANGAAIANGIAQCVAVGGLWIKATHLIRIVPPWKLLNRVVLSGTTMVLFVIALNSVMSPWFAVFVAMVIGPVVFAACLRMTRSLENEDFARFSKLGQLLPSYLRQPFTRGLRLLIAEVPESNASLSAS